MVKKLDKAGIYKLAEESAKIVEQNTNTSDVKVTVNVTKDRLPLPQNVMVFQAFATIAAIKLKPATNRILMFLFGLSAYENYLSIDIKTLSEQLELTDRSVISAINELVENKIILKFPHPTDKRRNDYFINPLAAWKGNSYARRTKIRAILKDKNQMELSLFNDPANEKHSLL
jgi:hypothetical protein